MDMNEIKEIFFQECEEQLAELESGLLRLNDGDTDPETVNAVFRAVHSIKGGAGAFGLDDLVSFAHVFETTLDCVRSNKLEASQDLLKVMLRSADVLADLTAASRDGGTVESSRTSGLVAELEAYAKGQPLPGASAAPARPLPLPPPSQRRPKHRPRLPKHLNPRMTAASSRCLSALTLSMATMSWP
jgi:two-component system chemotaxis sensor kinase CheA